VEVELKQPGKSPTLLQRARLEEWARNGAVAAVVRSADEMRELLGWLRLSATDGPPLKPPPSVMVVEPRKAGAPAGA
jgi:hypothetical protein